MIKWRCHDDDMTMTMMMMMMMISGMANTGEVLMIRNVTKQCDAEYECVAYNGVPPPVSKRIKLTVHCELHPLKQLKVILIAPQLDFVFWLEGFLLIKLKFNSICCPFEMNSFSDVSRWTNVWIEFLSHFLDGLSRSIDCFSIQINHCCKGDNSHTCTVMQLLLLFNYVWNYAFVSCFVWSNYCINFDNFMHRANADYE